MSDSVSPIFLCSSIKPCPENQICAENSCLPCNNVCFNGGGLLNKLCPNLPRSQFPTCSYGEKTDEFSPTSPDTLSSTSQTYTTSSWYHFETLENSNLYGLPNKDFCIGYLSGILTVIVFYCLARLLLNYKLIQKIRNLCFPKERVNSTIIGESLETTPFNTELEGVGIPKSDSFSSEESGISIEKTVIERQFSNKQLLKTIDTRSHTAGASTIKCEKCCQTEDFSNFILKHKATQTDQNFVKPESPFIMNLPNSSNLDVKNTIRKEENKEDHGQDKFPNPSYTSRHSLGVDSPPRTLVSEDYFTSKESKTKLPVQHELNDCGTSGPSRYPITLQGSNTFQLSDKSKYGMSEQGSVKEQSNDDPDGIFDTGNVDQSGSELHSKYGEMEADNNPKLEEQALTSFHG